MDSPIKHYVVFDIETTGLDKEKQAIIEIAACSFDHDLVDGPEYESKVMSIYGNREIQPKALEANGISREQIASGRDPKLVAEEFFNYLKSLKKGSNKVILVGQNSDKFDIPYLDNFFEFFGKNLSDVASTDFTIDTLWWGRIKHKELPNFKLGTLCEENGVILTNAHRAMADTRATKELVKIFLRGIKGENQQISQSSVVVEKKKFRDNFEF